MADKISTIILKVDLDCRRCYKKISKTICKLQERENIQTIIFDEKTNTVTISGPFDPKKMCKKLCCKACNVIKDIQIKENKEQEKPKDTKPKDAKPVPVPKPAPPPPPAAAPPPPPAAAPPPPRAPVPLPEQEKKPMEKPKETKRGHLTEAKKDRVDPPASITGTEPVWQPAWAGPASACGCQPLYGGYYGDNRGCWCGGGGGYRGGWMPEGPPPPAAYGVPVYGGGYNKPGTFFCEEDPQASCSVM